MWVCHKDTSAPAHLLHATSTYAPTWGDKYSTHMHSMFSGSGGLEELCHICCEMLSGVNVFFFFSRTHKQGLQELETLVSAPILPPELQLLVRLVLQTPHD